MSRLDHYTAHFHIAHLNGLGKVSWNITTGSLAGALINVFIPVYLWKLDYEYYQIFLYFACYGGVAAVSTYFGGYALRWIGGQRMLVIADIFDIAAYTLLALLSTISPPLFIIAALRGLSKGTYWPSYHAIFSKNRDRKKAGEQIGLINAVLITGASLGPVVGGIIASYYSISATYVLGIFLITVGALPLLYGKDITKGHVLDLRKLNSKGLWRDLLALYSESVNKAIVSIAWPLIIVLYVSSYAGIGALASIVTITSVIVTLYVGRRERIVGEKHYLAEGANMAAVSHAARLFATSPPAIVALNAINGITDALIKTPFTTRYYANADSQPRIEYIVIMEMAHSFAWMSYGLLLALVAMFFSLQVTLFVGVIVGVPAALGIRLIR